MVCTSSLIDGVKDGYLGGMEKEEGLEFELPEAREASVRWMQNR